MREQFGDEDLAERAPLVTRVTHPDDLRSTFETVARRRIGRRLTPQEAERFVRAYQAEEARVAQQAYDIGPTVGTVVAAVDPRVFAAERLAKEYGAEVGAMEMADLGNEFFKLLREVQDVEV